MLNIMDEFTRECIAIRINRRQKAADVAGQRSRLFHNSDA